MNLADPGTLKAFLARHGLSATKGLGQHFLCSASAVKAIVGALDGCNGLLEIGPGPGVLTSPLSEKVARLTALELDPTMIDALKESAPKAHVLQEDALKSNLGALLLDLPEPRAVVSNLPYYITGALLQLIADQRNHFDRAVLMMQREVAQRLMAGAKTPARGSLSVYLQSIFDIAIVAQVPAGAFVPPPKVDSTVLKLTPKVGLEPSDLYFKVIRIGFSQPRKTLANNLSVGFHTPRETMLKAIAAAGLGEKARPQELNLDEWKNLADAVATKVSS